MDSSRRSHFGKKIVLLGCALIAVAVLASLFLNSPEQLQRMPPKPGAQGGPKVDQAQLERERAESRLNVETVRRLQDSKGSR